MIIMHSKIDVKESFIQVIEALKKIDPEMRITRQEDLGLRNLAYKIRHSSVGRYFLINFESLPKLISDMSKNLQYNLDIMRHMIIKTEESISEESIMMQEINKAASQKANHASEVENE